MTPRTSGDAWFVILIITFDVLDPPTTSRIDHISSEIYFWPEHLLCVFHASMKQSWNEKNMLRNCPSRLAAQVKRDINKNYIARNGFVEILSLLRFDIDF